MRWYCLVALMTVFAGEGLSQRCWGQAGRGAVAPFVQVPMRKPALVWKIHHDDPEQIDLLRDGWQVGAYHRGKQVYRRIAGDGWSGPEAAPIPVPAAWVGPIAPIEDPPIDRRAIEQNFGVDTEKVGQHGAGYSLNGRGISRAAAYQAAAKGIPDDAGKLRVTVIGVEADRKKFETDWTAKAGELQARCLLWSVPPDHWSLKDNESGAVFKADGKPTVYLCAPDGKVLHRQDDWRDAGDVEVLRKAVKAYDASKDPDLRRPPAPPAPSPDSPGLPAGALVGGAAILLLFLRGKVNASANSK